MKKRTIEEYYLGLDIGTNSVGYAVTDPQYKILKYHGEPMWGSHVFEEGSQCAERRGFRTARRRLNRRQQRVRFVQEIFAHEIEKVDSRFFLRIKESALYREDANGKTVNEEDVEEIIKRLTYTEDKKRINKYLEENYPNISGEDRRYISKLKYKDFGRLSEKFLTGIKGVVKETGEILSVIQIMWETNDNLMQIIFSDHYTIKDALEREREDYYSEHPASVEQILSDMYVSNAVKRPIYRTLDIIGDVTKACQNAPRKIFVEMARGGGEKGKRTVSQRLWLKF